ncbi:MAG: hypothetical protein GXP53_07475 [Deltaproteobacteria bacterium]|nr:hypothetical protein [Deltaproteobacteria bacterium]
MAKQIITAILLCFTIMTLIGCALVSPTDPYSPAPAAHFQTKALRGPLPQAAISDRPVTMNEAINTALENSSVG